jgi:hypothetical protein
MEAVLFVAALCQRFEFGWAADAPAVREEFDFTMHPSEFSLTLRERQPGRPGLHTGASSGTQPGIKSAL